jgi:hypothetical protein
MTVPRNTFGAVDALRATFAPLDRLALGCAVGAWTGLALFIATIVLVAKGGATVGPHLALLAQYFPGYSVTPAGSVLGLVYGGVSGFALGWTFAFTRNLFVSVYLGVIKFRSAVASLNHFLDE